MDDKPAARRSLSLVVLCAAFACARAASAQSVQPRSFTVDNTLLAADGATVRATNVQTSQLLWQQTIPLCDVSSAVVPGIRKISGIKLENNSVAVEMEVGGVTHLALQSGDILDGGQFCLTSSFVTNIMTSADTPLIRLRIGNVQLNIPHKEFEQAGKQSPELSEWLRSRGSPTDVIDLTTVHQSQQALYERSSRASPSATLSEAEERQRIALREFDTALDAIVQRGHYNAVEDGRAVASVQRVEWRWIGCGGGCRHYGHTSLTAPGGTRILMRTDRIVDAAPNRLSESEGAHK